MLRCSDPSVRRMLKLPSSSICEVLTFTDDDTSKPDHSHPQVTGQLPLPLSDSHRLLRGGGLDNKKFHSREEVGC